MGAGSRSVELAPDLDHFVVPPVAVLPAVDAVGVDLLLLPGGLTVLSLEHVECLTLWGPRNGTLPRFQAFAMKVRVLLPVGPSYRRFQLELIRSVRSVLALQPNKCGLNDGSARSEMKDRIHDT